MDHGNDSYSEPMSTDISEDICDGIQSHPNVNRREAHSKIRDCIERRQLEWKGLLKATQITGKGLHKVFKIRAINGTGIVTEEYTPKNWRSRTAKNIIKILIAF